MSTNQSPLKTTSPLPNILAIVTLVIVGVVTQFAQDMITADISLVLIACVVGIAIAVGMAIRYFSSIFNHVKTMEENVTLEAKRLKETVGTLRHEEDICRNPEEFKNRARVHAALSKLMQDKITHVAKPGRKQILAVTLASVAKDTFFHRDSHDRKSYLDEIIKLLEKCSKTDTKITYTRIFQVEKNESRSFYQVFGSQMQEHCESAKILGEKYKNITVNFLYLTTSSLTGFLIIDEDTVVVVTGGVYVPPEGNDIPYLAGILIVEHNQDLYASYHERFSYLTQKAQEMSRDYIFGKDGATINSESPRNAA